MNYYMESYLIPSKQLAHDLRRVPVHDPTVIESCIDVFFNFKQLFLLRSALCFDFFDSNIKIFFPLLFFVHNVPPHRSSPASWWMVRRIIG